MESTNGSEEVKGKSIRKNLWPHWSGVLLFSAKVRMLAGWQSGWDA